MMQRKAKWMILLVGSLALVLNLVSLAQEHDHAAMDHSAHAAQSKSGTPAEDNDIFCPTMKTGQLCTHGTTNVLGVTAVNQAKWVEVARKYNKAVDAATLQLFKDSEGVLTPAQLNQLKAWFAVGLNPQINGILGQKGLGPKK
jgi:hypothetical protein